jgi:hypothetical protein
VTALLFSKEEIMLVLNPKFFVLPVVAALIIFALPREQTGSTAGSVVSQKADLKIAGHTAVLLKAKAAAVKEVM